jgi:hypothetical protein
MPIDIQLPKSVSKSNTEIKSEQDKIKEFLRKAYLELFYKTFGKPDENSSKLYKLYQKFVMVAPLNIPPNATLEQMESDVEARFYIDMHLEGRTYFAPSKIPNQTNNKPAVFAIKNFLSTSYYDPSDPKLRDLTLYFLSMHEPTEQGLEALPITNGKREAFICKIRVNPSHLDEIIVDCNANTIYQIGQLKKESILNFRSDESITLQERRSIETLLFVLEKIYPSIKESEILEMLRIKSAKIGNGRSQAENRPGRLKFDLNNIGVLEGLFEGIIQNPQKMSRIGNFEFTQISDGKYREVSNLPNRDSN